MTTSLYFFRCLRSKRVFCLMLLIVVLGLQTLGLLHRAVHGTSHDFVQVVNHADQTELSLNGHTNGHNDAGFFCSLFDATALGGALLPAVVKHTPPSACGNTAVAALPLVLRIGRRAWAWPAGRAPPQTV
ncbi:MAG: DUF2946 family protein [Limnobacter sp.]|nr:DUF2946 family protein [Limnobacter sp.]